MWCLCESLAYVLGQHRYQFNLTKFHREAYSVTCVIHVRSRGIRGNKGQTECYCLSSIVAGSYWISFFNSKHLKHAYVPKSKALKRHQKEVCSGIYNISSKDYIVLLIQSILMSHVLYCKIFSFFDKIPFWVSDSIALYNQ